MKLVLTSCGIRTDEAKQKVLSLFDKFPDKLRLLYITTAIDGETSDDVNWIKDEFNSILKLGIEKENIIEYKIGEDLPSLNFDVIYMMGGNTFYLLDKIRKYNFDKALKNMLNSGAVYIGSSAGSVILGKTIDVALGYDENNVGMTDFSGLNFVDGVVIPHAQRKQKFIEEYRKNNKYNLITLNDGDIKIIRN